MKILATVTLALLVACATARPRRLLVPHIPSVPYIVGGEDTTIEEHPWQVCLKKFGNHICGAVAIDGWNVLTAAHCVDKGAKPEEFSLGMGNENWYDGWHMAYSVEKIKIHPDHNPFYPFPGDDIAVLHTSQEIKRYPAGSATPIIDFIPRGDCVLGAPHTITGWGVTTSGGGFISDILQETTTTEIDKETCEARTGGGITITNKLVCFYNGETGACNGDSGGPAVNAQGELCGLVSWGIIDCPVTDAASVCTRVSYYKQWIDDNLSTGNPERQ